MLTREPDASLRTTFSQRLNILVQLYLPIPRRIASLKRRIGTETRKLIVLPIRDEDRRRFAIGRRCRVIG